jgi:hypothetical protein
MHLGRSRNCECHYAGTVHCTLGKVLDKLSYNNSGKEKIAKN